MCVGLALNLKEDFCGEVKIETEEIRNGVESDVAGKNGKKND